MAPGAGGLGKQRRCALGVKCWAFDKLPNPRSVDFEIGRARERGAGSGDPQSTTKEEEVVAR